MLESSKPEMMIDRALATAGNADAFRAELDRIEVPAYTTDTEGFVTYWNRACVEFAGREPQVGQDRWCVTWRLFTIDGDPLPHDECPMAVAIREMRSIRTVIAIAMRPNGSRVAFRPYPTPIFDDSGQFKGAINLLVDVSEEQAQVLKEQASRCRRLANSTGDSTAREILRSMAGGYEETARSLDTD
jgi:PAS domain-containing protein